MQIIVISALTLYFIIVDISALSMNAGMMALHMTPQQALATPSVESICTMRNAMLNPMDAKGVLSDLVGTEISKRSKYIRAYPHIAGAGKWGCAATFYASRHPPSELGNMFGDLIDTTGCNGFTCNMLTGPVPSRPLGGLMNAMIMSQMLNNMGGGSTFATGFGQPPLQGNPTQQYSQPTNQIQTPIVQQQSAQPAATSVQPAYVQPAYVQPASVQPAYVQPASVQPASVQPAYVQPAYVQPASVQARPAAQTPSNNNNMVNLFNNPMFQKKLMAFITQAMTNQNTAGTGMPSMHSMSSIPSMSNMPAGGLFF